MFFNRSSSSRETKQGSGSFSSQNHSSVLPQGSEKKPEVALVGRRAIDDRLEPGQVNRGPLLLLLLPQQTRGQLGREVLHVLVVPDDELPTTFGLQRLEKP